jgi:DNA-binding XRE family transcriptional regulator
MGDWRIPSAILRGRFSGHGRNRSKMSLIIGLVCRRSLYVLRGEWQCEAVNELRQLRCNADLSQRALAKLLDVPVNTFRMWDSGMRLPPTHVVKRTQEALISWTKQQELLPLDRLAKELGVHIRTLQAAARTGRLAAHFSVRSAFGLPIHFASRAAGEQFLPGTIGALVAKKLPPPASSGSQRLR